MIQKKYVDSTEQLVTEIVVRNIKRSTKFYRELGFEVLRDAGDFVELTWEDHHLYIAELSASMKLIMMIRNYQSRPSFLSLILESWFQT